VLFEGSVPSLPSASTFTQASTMSALPAPTAGSDVATAAGITLRIVRVDDSTGATTFMLPTGQAGNRALMIALSINVRACSLPIGVLF
jgi:hypothetical protein